MKRFLPFLLLAFLIACSPQTPYNNYHQGTEGVVAEFAPGYPPPQVYEESTVPVVLTFTNRGVMTVPYKDLLVTVKTDEFYAEAEQGKWGANGSLGPVLAGRGPGFPQGDEVTYLPYVDVKRIQGLRESPSTQIFASYCYPYATSLGTSVCIDSNAFNQNNQRQVCSAQTMTFQSQGAPVAVTSIENRPTPVRIGAPGGREYMDVAQPIFIIHIENKGTGRVVMPVPLEQREIELEEENELAILDQIAAGLGFEPIMQLPEKEERTAACAGDIPEGSLNQVSFAASLSGINLTCDPEVITLRDDKGFTTCTLPPEELETLSPANYLGVFRVDLGYLYRESLSTEIEILRREPVIAWDEATIPERDANAGYVQGEPRCEYCDRSPGSSECEGWPIGNRAMNKIDEPFTCSCGREECRTLTDDGRCVFGANWCPGTNYCCAREAR